MKEPAENEKVTEAAMTRSIMASVIGIVLCMACLVGTTWAWYSSSVTSGENVTVGANVDFEILITETGEESRTVPPTEDGVYTLTGGTYTVTVTKTGNAEYGFCQIIATKTGEGAGTTYCIVDFSEELNNTFTFTVTGSGTLKFTPMLGTPPQELSTPGNGIELTPSVSMASMLPQEETIPADEPQQPPEAKVPEQQEPSDGEPKLEEEIVEPDEDDKNVNENKTPPDETPTNSEPEESGTPTEPIPETQEEQNQETPEEPEK